MTSSNNSLVRTRDACRHHQMGASVIRAVDGISFEVRRGEFVALLGSSGSGKSTLLNLIAGLDRPTSGSIEVDGRDLAQMSSLELAVYRRRTVGMVFQAFNLIPSMTIEENVELPMRFAEIDRPERSKRAREALERVGLAGRLQHRPVELSGGEQQRVSLARSLVNQPALLLADEPTGNLDSRTGEEIVALFLELHERGNAIVLVTHEPRLAARCQRAVRVVDGMVTADGPGREVALATGDIAGGEGPPSIPLADAHVRALTRSV